MPQKSSTWSAGFLDEENLQCWSRQGGHSRDTQWGISHFYDGFLIDSRLVKLFFMDFRSISEKTLSAEYQGYTGDRSIIYHFQLKHK